jgi:hypothetical protein
MVASTNLCRSNTSEAVLIEDNRTGRDAELLTPSENEELQSCEKEIETNLKAFFEVGRALMEINRNRLYRARYGTFEEYCRKRWDMSRIHAFRLLKAAEVRQALLPIGNTQLPENEAQIRPLTLLSPKKALSTWQKVLEKAGTSKITARLVRLTVEEVRKKTPLPKNNVYNEWQHEIFYLLKKVQLATHDGHPQKASEILEKMRLVLDLQIEKELGAQKIVNDESKPISESLR